MPGLNEDILGPDGRIKKELVKGLVAEGIELGHKREYEAALAYAEHPGPAWEDLTEEQRANIRKTNIEYRQEMQAFGQSISDGSFFK